jgi:hypothetical protein
MLTEEPHNGNILASRKDLLSGSENIEIKLVDAIHFVEGTEDDLLITAFDYQELCRVYKEEFLQGLEYGKDEGFR